MKTHRLHPFLLAISGICLALAAFLPGCSDPTEGKPKAIVNEPIAIEPDSGEAAEAASSTAEKTDTRTYRFTDYTSIGFEGSKVTGPHMGGFSTFDGTITLAGEDIEHGAVDVTIDTASLFSDDPDLTKILTSADFFDVDHYPVSTFVSTAVVKSGADYDVTGNFSLHGITKGITFPASITVTQEKITVEAEFSIRRFDFRIEYPGAADDLIRDEVLILLDVEAALATVP